MPWLRIDEKAMQHPKIAALSDGAFRLWVEGLAYCQMFLTDGKVTVQAQRGLRSYSPKRRQGLLDATLWDLDVSGDGTIWVHDYLVWNESREHVEAARKFARERLQRYRETAKQRVTTGEATPATSHNITPDPPQREQRAYGHRAHTFCGQTFCVSHKQHELLMRELGSKRDGFDLLAAYPGWDKLNEPIDNLLPWLKAKIRNEIGIVATPIEAAITADERRKAEQYRRAIGGCRHDPQCASWAACIGTIVRTWREQEATA